MLERYVRRGAASRAGGSWSARRGDARPRKEGIRIFSAQGLFAVEGPLVQLGAENSVGDLFFEAVRYSESRGSGRRDLDRVDDRLEFGPVSGSVSGVKGLFDHERCASDIEDLQKVVLARTLVESVAPVAVDP